VSASTSRRRRLVAFGVLAVACVVAAVVSVAVAVVGAQRDRRAADRAVAAARPDVERLIGGKAALAVFRNVDRSQPSTYGRLAVAPLGTGRPGTRRLAGPSCSRVAFAAGRGLCLDVAGNGMAVIQLDAQLREIRRRSLPGIPSRARISPDGRWGGVTAFVLGHAYTSPGQFSTAATILDLRSGKVVGDLEKDFTVLHDGERVTARDRNYWGLTFAADGDTFYATLAAGDRTWLIRGSIRARRAETIHENVECPALSPDGTRVGYKKAVAHDPSVWRLAVLDLASGRETVLAETRSVDDQVEWVDDDHVAYAVDEQTWVAAADGSGEPRLWLDGADSPAIVRPRG
jgi:hypothetical protein